MMLALLLSGAMRWDVLRPWRRFGDRFVLSAGHTVPLVYATLAVLNEGVRARHERTACGAYVLRDYRRGQPRGGTVFVRGTMPTRNLVNVLPALDARGINVKIVAAVSPQLFARQPLEYRRFGGQPGGAARRDDHH